ncbi:MAG: ankyrin repeat domain-containing protein, partial [Chlamydiia bacterium]|nr:ankyrin repeat domain-containing protein [Chlamydiia bacterium]
MATIKGVTPQDPKQSSFNADQDLIDFAKQGRINFIEAALKDGANAHYKDSKGNTALHYAAMHGHREVVNLLLKRGAASTVINQAGQSPLDLAKQNEHEAVIPLLESSVNHSSSKLETASHLQDELALRTSLQKLFAEEDIVTTESIKLKSLLKNWEFNYLFKVQPLIEKCLQPHQLFENKQRGITNLFGVFDVAKEEAVQYQRLRGLAQELNDAAKLVEQIDQCGAVSLQKIANVYQKFVEECARSSNEKRIELLKGRVQIQGADIGNHYLAHEARSALFASQITNRYGRRYVANYREIHWKQNPLAPGIEKAVDDLNKIISGEGSPPTKLVKITTVKGAFTFLASQTISGTNLLDILLKYPEKIHNIDSTNFSKMIASGILADPIDGRPGNYIAKEVDGKLLIIGTCDAMAFSNVILEHKGKHLIAVKYVLYFFPQMDDQVDQAFRSRFLTLVPEVVIIDWLKSLIMQNKAYEKLYTQNVFTAADLDNLKLPIALSPNNGKDRGLIKMLYAKLCAMQQALRNNPKLTNRGLLEAAHPVLAVYYKTFQDNYIQSTPLEKQSIYDMIRNLYSEDNQALPIEEMISSKRPMCSRLTMGSYLAGKTHHAGDKELSRIQPPLTALQGFIASIDFARLGSADERKVIDAIKANPQITSLAIKNSKALTSKDLIDIGQSFKDLENLTLIGCSAITPSSVSGLLSKRPGVKLTLGQCAQLKAPDYNFLRKQNVDFVIKLASHEEIHAKKETANNLHQAIQSRDEAAICYLLYQLINPNAKDASGYSPLHLVIQGAQHNLASAKRVITALLLAGANPYAIHNNKTPLQKAQKYAQTSPDYQELATFLEETIRQINTQDFENLKDNIPTGSFINVSLLASNTEDELKLIQQFSLNKVGVSNVTLRYNDNHGYLNREATIH